MKIWIDADACPAAIKEIIFRAAERVEVQAVLVANRAIHFPRSPFLSLVLVPSGFNVADGHIVAQSQPGDLAITADIPLAALLVPKGVVVIDPRGELYSEANIGERLAMRNFMEEMRGAGLAQGGPRPLDPRDRQQFASTFDRELTRILARKEQA